MPNKKVFNIKAIDLEQLALCYGLSIAPSIEQFVTPEQQQQQKQDGEEFDSAMCGGAVGCGLHKKKNMSKLARLKVSAVMSMAVLRPYTAWEPNIC